MRYTAVLKSLALAARDQLDDADLRAFVADRHSLFRSEATTQQREGMLSLLLDPEYIRAMVEVLRWVAELGPEEPQR